MEYHSFKEWKQLGYIVKKGEHATKVDDDYKSTYLFSEEQVTPINNNFIDGVDQNVWKQLAKEKYPKIKMLLKENFNIDTEDESGKCKSLAIILEELSKKFHELQ